MKKLINLLILSIICLNSIGQTSVNTTNLTVKTKFTFVGTLFTGTGTDSSLTASGVNNLVSEWAVRNYVINHIHFSDSIQQVALNLKADLTSPTFLGVPTAPTAALHTNTTQLATTAFVVAEANSIIAGTYTLPAATISTLGGVIVSTGLAVDISGNLTANVVSVFGRVGAVTAQSGDYTFAQIGTKPTTLSGYGIVDAITAVTANATYAPLISPALTGTPTSTTATLGTNTTQIATTAFVQAAIADATAGGGYTLPIATGSVLGGVKIGSNVSIDGAGVISVTFPVASFNGRVGAIVPASNDYAFSQLSGKPTTIGGYGITDLNSLGDARWSLLAHTHTFSSITSKPTTLSGYGITDAYPLSGNPSNFLTSVPAQSFSSLTGKPTTLAGYGITDAYPLSGNPSNFLTSVPAQSFSSLTGKPTTLAGYGITDAYPLSGNPSNFLTSVPAQSFASLTSKPTTLAGYGITDAVPASRTITINGTTFDLSQNRTWTVSGGGSITPSNVAKQYLNGFANFVALNTDSLVEGSTNIFLTTPRVQTIGDARYSLLAHTHTFSSITSKPTTLSGYGITDAYPLSGNPSAFLTSVPAQSFASLTGKPTTLSGYGITDGVVSSRTITINGVAFDLSANRSWTVTATPDTVFAGNGLTTHHNTKDSLLLNLNINAPSTSYTLAITDGEGLVYQNSSSANNVTVPPNSSVGFPIGTRVLVSQQGTGQTTLVPGAGVTINSVNGLKISGRYGVVTLIQVAANVWLLSGNTTP